MMNAKSFDTRIVFLCVVNQTENSVILSGFLKNGGWNCIAKWLTLFMEKNQSAAILEVLKCLHRLPITLDLLKQAVETEVDAESKVKMPGKMIRTLRKHEDESVKKISDEIYKNWSGLLEADNRKIKKKVEKEKKSKSKELNGKTKKANGPQCK
jgi:hypothetical protein